MTYAAVPALRRQPDVAAEWDAAHPDDRVRPRFVPAQEKTGVLLGMAMTEKQGGIRRARQHDARAPPAPAGPAAIPHDRAQVVLLGARCATRSWSSRRRQAGCRCFLLPRFPPDGRKNRFFIQRLKDKLGNRSNASSEVEFDGAWARWSARRGAASRPSSRWPTTPGSTARSARPAMMRQALSQALHHAAHRAAFGRQLPDQPLMRNVLADLAVESEAADALTMRLARAYDRKDTAEPEEPFRRVMTAASKYWVCKRAPSFIARGARVPGRRGFVEECILPRLYREAPLNSIWEGSGNVMCLDVLRAISKDAQALPAALAEIRLASGQDRRFDAFVAALEADAVGLDHVELQARRFVERLVLAVQGSLLLRAAPAAVADAFCASRLAGDWGHAFGTLPAGADVPAILARTCVA